ncbi:hypothetical protein [Mycobacteroides abscessus]|uniref:hypothetical protein n=1 Tax=Mycobacteroides abscessus TaxID=36809 RepID=UPI000925C1C7|nr:hypothetical protein [Mycobacteroides abscessus]SIC68214.1 Uncharacterised protein [Mycobacteroides abscessus subsp. abscessus]SID38225.1 Uncharacterised protein [Mycobacteroides abscessus subsp. abscessus]SID53894.1 Uncharacterised protein [Mycobacteroides abscessus subsp. abscessus]SKK54474.1 Uncharacterised protein [Mycobacteroides abscessus subsp. abscessus]SKV09810.1 Uncharacterised protein [Mycobacteroides abscessus subsp. abscessus]
MSDEPSDAHKLIAEVILRHQPNEWGQHDGWWECCCQHGGPLVPWTPEHVAAEVDKALGGLTRAEAFRLTVKQTGRFIILDDVDVKAARKIANNERNLTEVSRWVSGWTEVTQ